MKRVLTFFGVILLAGIASAQVDGDKLELRKRANMLEDALRAALADEVNLTKAYAASELDLQGARNDVKKVENLIAAVEKQQADLIPLHLKVETKSKERADASRTLRDRQMELDAIDKVTDPGAYAAKEKEFDAATRLVAEKVKELDEAKLTLEQTEKSLRDSYKIDPAADLDSALNNQKREFRKDLVKANDAVTAAEAKRDAARKTLDERGQRITQAKEDYWKAKELRVLVDTNDKQEAILKLIQDGRKEKFDPDALRRNILDGVDKKISDATIAVIKKIDERPKTDRLQTELTDIGKKIELVRSDAVELKRNVDTGFKDVNSQLSRVQTTLDALHERINTISSSFYTKEEGEKVATQLNRLEKLLEENAGQPEILASLSGKIDQVVQLVQRRSAPNGRYVVCRNGRYWYVQSP